MRAEGRGKRIRTSLTDGRLPINVDIWNLIIANGGMWNVCLFLYVL